MFLVFLQLFVLRPEALLLFPVLDSPQLLADSLLHAFLVLREELLARQVLEVLLDLGVLAGLSRSLVLLEVLDLNLHVLPRSEFSLDQRDLVQVFRLGVTRLPGSGFGGLRLADFVSVVLDDDFEAVRDGRIVVCGHRVELLHVGHDRLGVEVHDGAEERQVADGGEHVEDLRAEELDVVLEVRAAYVRGEVRLEQLEDELDEVEAFGPEEVVQQVRAGLALAEERVPHDLAG